MNSSIWTIRNLEPVTLGALERAFTTMCSSLEATLPHPMSARPSDDPATRIRQQVAVIAALAHTKLRSLCVLVIHSIEKHDWLTYGMVGRSIIEHAATLRYYLREKIVPLLPAEMHIANVTPEMLAEIQQIFFQLIRGGRFDWTNLLEEWLAGTALPDAPLPSQPTQVNVLTCIQKWSKEEPRIEQLYSMFCDLVHPNLGSSLLVVGISAESISFGSHCENSLGEAIVCGTGLAIHEVAQNYLQAIERMQEVSERWAAPRRTESQS